ncbi:MAG: polysaccharide export outer membrane protein [Mariniblastus sp.]|jgi:polysaccharide export outer membrane protein
MRLLLSSPFVICGLVVAAAITMTFTESSAPRNSLSMNAESEAAEAELSIVRDENIRLCQAYGPTQQCGCQGQCTCGASQPSTFGDGFGYASAPVEPLPARHIEGVNQFNQGPFGRESRWRNGQNIPWEQLAYGEYIGPHRTPHIPQNRLRINDQLEFVYLRTREKSLSPYRMYVGDTIQISSAVDASLNQTNLIIRPDGMISLSLIGEALAAGKTVAQLQSQLNEKYLDLVKNPSIVVQVIQGETPLQDIIDSVDARQGQGGQSRAVQVTADGTIQLPGIGSVPAIGLTLQEIRREVNARYRLKQGGIEVTPILTQRAPSFAYVIGAVNQVGQIPLDGPTTVIQALALAQGTNATGNLRQVIVFRRDQNWRLSATKLDLNGALLGKRPYPSDDIWLRHSDIVLVPPKPIARLSDAVDQYFTQTLYGLFPAQLGSFDAGAVLQ